jgi:hypothetical protein
METCLLSVIDTSHVTGSQGLGEPHDEVTTFDRTTKHDTAAVHAVLVFLSWARGWHRTACVSSTYTIDRLCNQQAKCRRSTMYYFWTVTWGVVHDGREMVWLSGQGRSESVYLLFGHQSLCTCADRSRPYHERHCSPVYQADLAASYHASIALSLEHLLSLTRAIGSWNERVLSQELRIGTSLSSLVKSAAGSWIVCWSSRGLSTARTANQAPLWIDVHVLYGLWL